MSCVEKRHMSHRAGSMLHHRFPNGFTDLFMDDTDREVSTLTDRAFRSLCVGDDAVYNDEFFYGYSPFSCHKPLAGEPAKKTRHKESKKQGQSKNNKDYNQSWKQQHQKSLSHMSSFLKALSATEESCEGMLIKNGGMTDSKGESWDKSALRSIQRELSEFSSDYRTHLKDAELPTGKSSKIKNGKSAVKLRRLNIRNFFLHSEFSPFQSWRDFKRFPFCEEDTVLPTENIPDWYDMPLYKELTEAHRKETLHTEEAQSCQKAPAEPPPPTAPKPVPPSPPPKVLPKPSLTQAGKRCPSAGGDGTCAPWRRNKAREKSVIPFNPPGIPPQDNGSKTVDESLLLVKKEVRPVEVKTVEEVSSLASTPFSICQLMTPLIPSRQPTETSEILQDILSPSALDLPLRPHSEVKLTPEPPLKRDGYKSLASSILFNLKDNRKRVKSRYSPPKFKTLEVPGSGTQSPQSDYLTHPRAGSEGNASGLSTPTTLKEGQTVCSPILESNSTPTTELNKHDTDRPLSGDYLLSNLLHTKRESASSSRHGEENTLSPLIHSRKNKSPNVKKQNYPSLNLYKRASPVDSDTKYLQVPLSTGAPMHTDQPAETNELSPLALSKELSPKQLPTNTGLSPNALYVNKDQSPIISPRVLEKEGLSSKFSVGKRPPNVPEKQKQPANDVKEKYSRAHNVSSKEKDTSGQSISTMDVIRAAKEAINAAKSKALSAVQSDSITKVIPDIEERREKETKEMVSSKRESSGPENSNVLSQCRDEAAGATPVSKKGHVKKAPPPVPKKNFVKSDIVHLDKKQRHNLDTLTNGEMDAMIDLQQNENKSVQKPPKSKHIFSAKQNNYIKYQRFAVADDGQREESEEGDLKVNTRMETDEETMSLREIRDSEHISNDLHALKELEKARLGDRVLEQAKNRLGAMNIDEETRAKSDLISRELRNIKKGMLLIRSNTSAKRELFANKEMEQNTQEVFTKIDSNVRVNKTLFNDNYDKAKMALEEIISDRQKRRNKLTEQDANPIFNEKISDESYVSRAQKYKKPLKDSMTEDKTTTETDLKERLGDFRDHNHMRQILSQTEPGLDESHITGGRIALPVKDKTGSELNAGLKSNAKHVNDKATDRPSHESKENVRHMVRQISEESGENMSHSEGKKGAAPPVPPRSKKGWNRRDGRLTKETDSFEDVVIEDGKTENDEIRFEEMRNADSEKQKLKSDLLTKESVLNQKQSISDKESWDVVNDTNSEVIAATDLAFYDSSFPSADPQSEYKLYSSPELRGNENEANHLQDLRPSVEATVEADNDTELEPYKVKNTDVLKEEDLNTSDHNVNNSLAVEEPEKRNRAIEETYVDAETLSETPRSIMSPLLLINGISINQSPPDQASLSSKSSYFSVESALHRNTETESNVYHSLENLIAEVDEVMRNVSQNANQDSDKVEVEYYSLSDHESEPEFIKRPIKCPQRETDARSKDGQERENDPTDQILTHDENTPTPMSTSNTFSPSLGIPALFKVKDNTLSNKQKKNVQPWPPRGNLIISERREELHQVNENLDLPPVDEPVTRGNTPIPDEIFKPKDNSPNSSPPLLQPPSNLQSENKKEPEFGAFLTVPQQDDRFSGVSPSPEGVETLTTSTADTSNEIVGAPEKREVPKVPSERSESTCSGNDSQAGLPKPPAVLPKSEKAVLKAIKLANRRMKKEEAQQSSQKLSRSSSKQRTDRHGTDKSEHSSRNCKSHDKKTDGEGHRHSEGPGKCHNDRSVHPLTDRRGHSSENHHQDRTHIGQKTRRQSHDSVGGDNQSNETLASVTERQGRSSNRRVRDKPDQRHYSSDRVISHVPVYKAHISGKPASDRQLQRSQSIDRYVGDKVERRLSVDMSINEKSDPRAQRIEKSIKDELEQRGRARAKASRDNTLRRSRSIDAYSTEVPHPSPLCRQSSHTSQLSRQSSIEHTIVTQSFPMTQRKLLQDPESGQYFFVDMPVQIKTKTFFDPETGSYVQLPVQPPDGAVPQASPLEVLTPPLVVYHSFVPVPLSPMAQAATIQAPHIATEESEKRRQRSKQMQCQEKHPYLEPVYAQHDHMLGEFLGTDELDCPS